MIYRMWGGKGIEESRMNPIFLAWGTMRGGTVKQMRNKGGGGASWGMEEESVISLDWGVLSFLGDNQWRCTIGNHA